MHDLETERDVLAQYPLWTLLMVQAAKKALDEKRARVEDGFLIVDPPAAMRAVPRLTRPQKEKYRVARAKMTPLAGPHATEEPS